jgi:putative nucleotidyltransferase with HDIG domain
LARKILRAVGDPAQRFEEDKLRLLRAVRFATVLGFDVEEKTWSAIVAQAPQIHAVSAERIREELLKLFRSPNRVRGLDLLDASRLLAEVLPEVTALKGCEQPPQFHPEGDVFVHTRIMLELLAPEVPDSVFLSVLFHDIGKPPTFSVDETGRIRFSGHDAIGAEMTREVMQRLRFPNEEIDRVVAAVANHMVFKDVTKMRVSRLKRFMARPDFDREIELHRVDCASSHGDLSNVDFLRQKAEEFASEPLIPPALVTGRDLIALGLKPGPIFKEILDAVETAQLEKQVTTREEALELVAQIVSDRNSPSFGR